MIRIKTVQYVDLSAARPGEKFEHKGRRFQVLYFERYERGGQERVAVVLRGYCAHCQEVFEFTTRRRSNWLPLTCPRHRGMA